MTDDPLTPDRSSPPVDPPATNNDTTLPSPGSGAVAGRAVPGYEIQAVLGDGGMGIVYRARQVSLNRTVALKMIKSREDASPQQLARFYLEAAEVSRLDHPHVVRIHDFGEHQGLPYFSMELVEGGSLEKKFAGRPQPPRQAAQLVEMLARTMQYVHEQRIVHRDLKPANVLLKADGTPKIADFGLAKRLDDDQNLTGSRTVVMGTACYMAPEQARGRTQDVGPAADVWALGAILYALLTGRPPFKGETYELTLAQVRLDDPVPPSHLRADVPDELEAICLKCLEKEPGRRYASAACLADDLRHFLDGEPISIETVGEWEWRERWARRAGYELLEVLTCGVRDVVYKAREVGLPRPVLLKVLTTMTPAEPEEMTRFRREAELLARLHHPNIVQVYNFGEHSGRAYISLEFVDGGNLIEQYVDEPVPAQQAARLVEALARAMHHAHQRNVLHCALKPSNVLLTADGTPKISNFGLSILLEKEQTEAARKHALRKLPSYMAPELAEGRIADVGPAADVYSLGAILYKLLTGGPPFLGDTVPETLEQVRLREPVPPRRLQPEVPRELEAICLHCLHKEPARRPPSAEALADWLRRFLDRQETVTGEFELVPGYEVLEELGHGGLGIVHRARHIGLDRLMALKIFHRLDPDWLGRIRAASQAVARLKHPNLLQVHDCGERDGLLFVAEELVEGVNLELHVGDQMQPPRAAARLVEALARAMQHAHEHGIIHRNLKPGVVLLASGGREPPGDAAAPGASRHPLTDFTPKVSSFEMARLLKQPPAGPEREGTVTGTPPYMAPEQSMGRVDEIGPATDVYALGAILLYLLTGRKPFSGETLAEVFEQVRSQPPLPPSRIQPAVTSDLDAICLKCLHKEPARRYASAEELADDLRRFLDGKPVRARPVSVWERLGKWLRRQWRRPE
jgi:serine/threonine protein kinase